ncbi:TetR family transcriptional regulator [Gordonia sp. HNM0687]|uniref:TetR family transcriptional regulator n=1 Tax=Gordonia mangrovi TaxID=2665643 RepID=A0A6L7GY24_9ACTN|nr:TetR family transcriptional regulator [Gordonia mangrovi]MXP24101.1 TetR family transcriptional regulator [Gordonia mangrovi]UVF78096.1 TetR family transcriptional regulator [Gordonia mangrovi]
MSSARRRGRPRLGPTVDNRERILTTAREMFSESGFERTTMRAIGRRAGVDPALIHHYFGTKNDLLVAALRPEVDVSTVFAGIAEADTSVGCEFVHRVVDLWESDPQQRARAVALLRIAVTHEEIADRLREFFLGVATGVLGQFVHADQLERRVALVMSQMLGLVLARYVMRVPGIAEASAAELSRWVGPTIDNYLFGEQ